MNRADSFIQFSFWSGVIVLVLGSMALVARLLERWEERWQERMDEEERLARRFGGMCWGCESNGGRGACPVHGARR